MTKFIYFYSPIYEIYHKHISSCLAAENIDYGFFKINDIIKEKNSGHTFGGGEPVKIKVLIDSIKDNFEKDIVFSDCTIVFNKEKLNKIKNYFDYYDEYDLCWQINHVPNTGYNIGITKIKCNEKMLAFFEQILDNIINTKNWDQYVCNDTLIKNINSINFKKFDDQIVTDQVYNKKIASKEFLIWKHLILHDNKTQEEILNARLKEYENAGVSFP